MKIGIPGEGILAIHGGFCLTCGKRTDQRIDVVPITFNVRGLECKGKEMRVICLECGHEKYDHEINDKNVELRNSAYMRALRGI